MTGRWGRSSSTERATLSTPRRPSSERTRRHYGQRPDAPPVGFDGNRQDLALAEERRRGGQKGRATGRDRERQGQHRGGGLRLRQAEQDRRPRRRERPHRSRDRRNRGGWWGDAEG